MSIVGDAAEVLRTVREWPARYFLATSCVAGGLLVASHGSWAATFGVANGPWWLRLALTLTALFTAAIGLVKAASRFAECRAQRSAARRRGEAFEQEMRSLTPAECAVFASFVDCESKTASFLNGSGNVSSAAHALSVRNHIYVISRERTIWFEQAMYVIQEPVFEFFKRNPELLERGRPLLKEAK